MSLTKDQITDLYPQADNLSDVQLDFLIADTIDRVDDDGIEKTHSRREKMELKCAGMLLEWRGIIREGQVTSEKIGDLSISYGSAGLKAGVEGPLTQSYLLERDKIAMDLL